jgi:UDP-glucuronate decarboxylase
MVELAELLVKMVGSSSKVMFEKLPEDDPKRRCPDISKARQHLDWEPQVPLEEGLRKTIEYFVNNAK